MSSRSNSKTFSRSSLEDKTYLQNNYEMADYSSSFDESDDEAFHQDSYTNPPAPNELSQEDTYDVPEDSPIAPPPRPPKSKANNSSQPQSATLSRMHSTEKGKPLPLPPVESVKLTTTQESGGKKVISSYSQNVIQHKPLDKSLSPPSKRDLPPFPVAEIPTVKSPDNHRNLFASKANINESNPLTKALKEKRDFLPYPEPDVRTLRPLPQPPINQSGSAQINVPRNDLPIIPGRSSKSGKSEPSPHVENAQNHPLSRTEHMDTQTTTIRAKPESAIRKIQMEREHPSTDRKFRLPVEQTAILQEIQERQQQFLAAKQTAKDVLPKDPYDEYPWYHPNIERPDATAKLRRLQADGSFLIRKSAKDPAKPYTLDVMYYGRDFHVPIRKLKDCSFAIGSSASANEMTWNSLDQMVDYFRSCDLSLTSAELSGPVKLTKSPFRF